MFEVYLAGRIDNLSYAEAVAERDELAKKLEAVGIKCRSPMRGMYHNISKIDTASLKSGLTSNEIIQRDLSDVSSVDVVVVLTGDDASWGTAGEFYYATWVSKTPTLVIAKNNVGYWMERYATKVVTNFDSAIEVLVCWKTYWSGDEVYSMR